MLTRHLDFHSKSESSYLNNLTEKVWENLQNNFKNLDPDFHLFIEYLRSNVTLDKSQIIFKLNEIKKNNSK